jgi:hypothetical protein
LIFSKNKEVYVIHSTCVHVADWVKQKYTCMVIKKSLTIIRKKKKDI